MITLRHLFSAEKGDPVKKLQKHQHEVRNLEEQLRQQLELEHGLLLSGDVLRRTLGFPSGAALRRAHERRLLPIPVFRIPNRRGIFALTRDVADWIAKIRAQEKATTYPERRNA